MVLPQRARILMAATAAAVSVAVGATLLTSGGEASADAALDGCQTTGKYEVCLTNPDKAGESGDLTIIKRLREYVQSAKKDDTIRMVMYHWDLADAPEAAGIIDDLVAARDRGVTVYMMLGDFKKDDGASVNKPVIDKIKKADLNLKVCERTCLPGATSDGPIHAKFFLIERGDEVQVAHTSTNFTKGQFLRHQNMLSVTGDQKLYDNYLGYWKRMVAESWNYDGDNWKDVDDRSREGDYPGSMSYFYPLAEGDPVSSELKKLTCREGHDRVWVTASAFGRVPVAEDLDNLADAGCDVKIVVAKDYHKEFVQKHSKLKNVRILGGDGSYLSQHNKLIISNADYEGKESTAVYAGSHNLDNGGLRDTGDAMIRTSDAGVHKIYEDYFAKMYGMAT